MNLADVRAAFIPKKSKKRLGRGWGYGHGKTSGRGNKGQQARSGSGKGPGFEGGQMPLYRRIPKRGFNNHRFRTVYAIVNIGQLEGAFEDGAKIDVVAIRGAHLVNDKSLPIKVLGGGMLTSRFRYWGSYAFNIVIRVVLGLRIHDNLSGYLAFRPTLLRGISPEAVFYGYGDYAIRLLHHVVREGGGRVLEIPTVYRFRKGGESKTRFLAYLWTYLASVFRLRFARR